jgi:hypothetical protein
VDSEPFTIRYPVRFIYFSKDAMPIGKARTAVSF